MAMTEFGRFCGLKAAVRHGQSLSRIYQRNATFGLVENVHDGKGIDMFVMPTEVTLFLRVCPRQNTVFPAFIMKPPVFAKRGSLLFIITPVFQN
jgi:hypothetical protein